MADLTIGGLTPTASVQLTDKVPKEPTAGPPAEYFLVSQLKTLLDTIYAPITGGAYVLKAGDTMTGLLTIAQATANTSNLILSGHSLTGANAQSLMDLAGTWNTTGVPTAIRLNITNTASGALSMLMDLRVGGASMMSVEKDGDIRSAGQIFATSALYGDSLNILSGGAIGRIQFTSSVDGVLNILPWTGSDMLIKLGGTTSAFPALKRSGTIVQARLGDDSTFGTFQGILQTSVNATAEAPPVTTHTIPIVDAAGVTYRCPCLV